MENTPKSAEAEKNGGTQKSTPINEKDNASASKSQVEERLETPENKTFDVSGIIEDMISRAHEQMDE